MAPELEEKVIRVRGHRMWTSSAGSVHPGRPPVLVVHGGPQIPHDYLLPLAGLAGRGHRIVFYDQLGCGRSDRPDDPNLWSMEAFTDEIGFVRDALDLPRVVLFGHSMGALFVLAYLARQPAGVVAAVLASPVASVPEYSRTALEQIGPPGDATRDMVERHENDGTTQAPEYRAWLERWMTERMLRLPRDRWPAEVERAFETAGWPVYDVLWNGSQFRSHGLLSDVDLRDAATTITVPTLVTNGEHDYVTPATGRDLAARLPHGRHVEIAGTSHLPWFEQPAAYTDLLDGFLREVAVPEPA